MLVFTPRPVRHIGQMVLAVESVRHHPVAGIDQVRKVPASVKVVLNQIAGHAGVSRHPVVSIVGPRVCLVILRTNIGDIAIGIQGIQRAPPTLSVRLVMTPQGIVIQRNRL